MNQPISMIKVESTDRSFKDNIDWILPLTDRLIGDGEPVVYVGKYWFGNSDPRIKIIEAIGMVPNEMMCVRHVSINW